MTSTNNETFRKDIDNTSKIDLVKEYFMTNIIMRVSCSGTLYSHIQVPIHMSVMSRCG